MVPVTIGSGDFEYVIPGKVSELINSLRDFIVEDIRSARRFLRMVNPSFPIDECSFTILDKNSRHDDIINIITCIKKGGDHGLMSEAGLPCIADPGAGLVALAHKEGIKVIPLTGPSSIFLALMASGMSGQNFAFNGYLPIRDKERSREIRRIEALALKGQSQIFMETPYRNMKLLDDLCVNLSPGTSLCIAAGISTENEFIVTRTISEWKEKGYPDINRIPSIFVIGTGVI